MTAATERLADQALLLPCNERVYLADRLLASLDAASTTEVGRQLATEAERRIAELDSGKAEELPGDLVMSEIRKRLQT